MTNILHFPEADEFNHLKPKFFGAMLADILHIKEILDPVFPMELDIWQAYFNHCTYPGKEIRWWLSFAEKYSERANGKSAEERRQVFEDMLKKQ